MLNLMEHFYLYAETYTILSVWVVIPLTVGLCYLRFIRWVQAWREAWRQNEAPELKAAE
jgi:hypothetical protein